MRYKQVFALIILGSVQSLFPQNFSFNPNAFGANLFAGGMDNPRFQFVDIDGDLDLDLFILDRDEKLWFYRNVEGTFFLEPNTSFGLTVGSWMHFIDIDHDGDNDCFTNGSFSEVSLYTNIGSSSSPQFQLTTPALLDTSGVELFSERFSIPTFADIDGDGDEDFFSGGSIGSVSFYKNIGTPNSPQFTFITSEFEGINIQGGPGSFPKAMHGASSIEFFDADSNGVLDLFWGDYFNPSLYFLYNNGTAQIPNIVLVDSTYPNESVISSFGFNIPQHVDMDGDGFIDLMIGSVYPNSEIDNFQYYRNTGTNKQPFYELQTSNFISMIDAGSRSTVAADDFDNDGDIDLVVSSALGTINVYNNIGTNSSPQYSYVPSSSFLLENNLYSTVSSGDVNNDGKPDLLVGNFNGKIRVYGNSSGNGSISFSPISHPLDAFSVSQSSAPCLADLDGDGADDILIGNSGGRLVFLKNSGTNVSPSYSVDTSLSFIDVGNDAIPNVSDFDHDGLLDLLVGNNQGEIYYYRQSSQNKLLFTLQSKSFGDIHLNLQSAPMMIDLDDDGDSDLLLGNGKGGIMFYENTGTSHSKIQPDVSPRTVELEQNFPNPFNPSTKISFSLPSDSFVSLKIFDMLGKEVDELIHSRLKSGIHSVSWHATKVSTGAYFYRLTVSNSGTFQTVTRRMTYIQ